MAEKDAKDLLEVRKKLLLTDLLELMDDIKNSKNADSIQILLRHFKGTINQHLDEIKTIYKTKT